MEFNWPVRVYIEDTDAGGIVYYVNYLKYLERARTEMLRHIGFDHARMLRQGVMFVIHSVQVDYKYPAYLDDQLQVATAVIGLGRAQITFQQTIARDGQVLTQAKIKGVCVKKETMKPSGIPAPLLRVLQTYLREIELG